MIRSLKTCLIAVAVVTFVSGVCIGSWSAIEESRLLDSVQYMAPTEVISNFARTQFLHADGDHAREAVMLQIQLLDRLQSEDKSSTRELALAYVRLAIIEETAGKPDAEEKAMAQARELYKRIHSQTNASDDELKNVIKRRDRVFGTH